VQRPESPASGQGRVGRPSLIEGPVAGEDHDGVDRRVDRLDPPQERLDDLDGRDRALTDEPGDADRSVQPDVFHHREV